MKIIPLIFVIIMLAGGTLSSCRHDIASAHGCDTCKKPCDTCKMDTTHHGCDTCNINKDSAAHAFTWKEFKIPFETWPTSVWVFGPNDMIIVGNNLWHFDGTNFTDLQPIRNGSNTPMDGGLNGFQIFAFSQMDYWLTSYGGAAFHTSDGKHFDDNRFGAVNGCWGTHSGNMYFTGNQGLINHYDGMSFTKMISPTTQNLGQLWGTSDNNISTCNTNLSTGAINFLHYNGKQWMADPFVNSADVQLSGLGGLWTVDSSGHEFTVTAGDYVFRKTDNGLWRKDPYVPNKLPDSTYIYTGGLRGNTANDFWNAAGYVGWAGHWNGKTWMKADSIYAPGNKNYYSSGMSVKGNIICIVGTKDGNSWVAVGTRKQ